MTIKEMIDFASKKTGYIEANKLMEYVLNVDKSYLIINAKKDLDAKCEEIYKTYLKKIEEGYPLQYITKSQEFIGLKFEVNEDVLIPQPDTECLVEEAIKQINILSEKRLSKYSKVQLEKAEESYINNNLNTDKIKVLDLCTGSGAIAISIAKYAQNVKVYASDISDKAIEIAKKNYENIINNKDKNSNQNKLTFIQSDMFENINEKFDVIVSNPPYIKSNVIQTLSKDVQNEPHIALDGGEDGLKFYRIIRENISRYLKEDGIILLEIGYDQREELLELFEGGECIKDLAGNDRVILWKKC